MTEGEGDLGIKTWKPPEVKPKTQRPLPNNGDNLKGADLKIAAAAAMHSRRVLGLEPKRSVAILQGLYEINQKN